MLKAQRYSEVYVLPLPQFKGKFYISSTSQLFQRHLKRGSEPEHCINFVERVSIGGSVKWYCMRSKQKTFDHFPYALFFIDVMKYEDSARNGMEADFLLQTEPSLQSERGCGCVIRKNMKNNRYCLSENPFSLSFPLTDKVWKP